MPQLLCTVVDSGDVKGFIHVSLLFDGNVTCCFTQIDHRDEKLRHSRHLHPPLGASQEAPNREYGVSRGHHHQIE